MSVKTSGGRSEASIAAGPKSAAGKDASEVRGAADAVGVERRRRRTGRRDCRGSVFKQEWEAQGIRFRHAGGNRGQSSIPILARNRQFAEIHRKSHEFARFPLDLRTPS